MLEKRGIVIHPHELDMTWLKRCSEMKLNVLGLHPVGGTNADISLRSMLDNKSQLKVLIDEARRMGITVEYEMHALSYLMPKSLFDEHPEWFCMNEDSVRTKDSFNICASSTAGLDALADNAEQLARLLPSEDHMYYFWLDDSSGGSCHCPKCAHLTPSDQQMILVNTMLRGIRRFDAVGCIAYLAYNDSISTPVNVKPDKGVFLEYAPFRRSIDYAINDSACVQNVRECAHIESLLNVFGTKNAKVLDYWTDNSMFSGWKYPPKAFKLNAEVMRSDVKFYKSLGFNSITAFGCYLGKDYSELYGEPDLEAYGQILFEA